MGKHRKNTTRDTKTRIPQTAKNEKTNINKVGEKIKSQTEINQMGEMNTSKRQACKGIAKAEKQIQEQRGALLRNCTQAWGKTTQRKIPKRRRKLPGQTCQETSATHKDTKTTKGKHPTH